MGPGPRRPPGRPAATPRPQVQGSADKALPWEEIGERTAALFDAVRRRLGDWRLPVVDSGANLQHALSAGKAYAAQLVRGCEVAHAEMAVGAENPLSTCVISPSEPCLEATFFNHALMDAIGWDPNWPADARPAGASNRTFRWFKAFPSNLHSEADGMVLLGRLLANEYVRAFTAVDLPAGAPAVDPAAHWPWRPCEDGAEPSADKFCWIDERGDAAADCEPRCPAWAACPPNATHISAGAAPGPRAALLGGLLLGALACN